RGGDFGDVADLGRQVSGQLVDLLRQVLPGPGGAGDAGLAAEAAFGADFSRHPADLAGERIQLVDHDVDRVLELQDLALDLDRDLLGEVALLHRGGDVGDVAHLGGEITGHEVDVVGEVLPDAADAADLGLATQLALSPNLAGDP